MDPKELVVDLEQGLGPRLKSVVLYGSAAAGDFVAGVSTYDLLLVVDPLGMEELAALSAPLREWTDAGNTMPEIFTPTELQNSADVFPIEFMDMQQARRVLYGADPLAELKVDMQHFRTELERELKTKLLLLRRKYLAVADEPDEVAPLMLASVSTFLVLLRASLRLYNEAVPADKVEALESLAQRLKLDLSPMRRVAEAKAGDSSIDSQAVAALFGQYLSAIGLLVDVVDRHLHSPS